MTKKPKVQRVTVAWFTGLFKAGVFTGAFTVISTTAGWITSVESRLTAAAAGINQNHDAINHNYSEIKDDLSDIKQTVHDISDRMNQQ